MTGALFAMLTLTLCMCVTAHAEGGMVAGIATGMATVPANVVMREGTAFSLPTVVGAQYLSDGAHIVAAHPSGTPCYARTPGDTLLRLMGDDGTLMQTVRAYVLPEQADIALTMTSPYVGQGGSVLVAAHWTDADVQVPPMLTTADETIARIENGAVIGVTLGQTEIIAQGEGGFIEKRFPIAVVPRQACTSLRATIPYRFAVGESRVIQAYPKPVDTTDEVRYRSDAPAVLTVSDAGIMTAVAPGRATVSVHCGERAITQVVYVR